MNVPHLTYGAPGLATVRRLGFLAASVLQAVQRVLQWRIFRLMNHRQRTAPGSTNLWQDQESVASNASVTRATIYFTQSCHVSATPKASAESTRARRDQRLTARKALQFRNQESVPNPDLRAPGILHGGAHGSTPATRTATDLHVRAPETVSHGAQLLHQPNRRARLRAGESSQPWACCISLEKLFDMKKKFLKRYRHTIALVAVLIAALCLFEINLCLGASLFTATAVGGSVVGCWQLSQFALSKGCGVCFHSVLTPEQVREFGQILDSLKEYKSILPGLKGLDIGRLKNLPGDLDRLEDSLNSIRRAGVGRAGQVYVPPGSIVSDDCARQLVGLAIVAGHRKGKFDLLESAKRESIMNMGKSFLGDAEFKTALSSADIPLPVGYSGEVVALVGMYGAARKYGTVFPAGNGQLKLPRLKTDPTFGLIAGSGTVTEKSPQTEWVTFNAEKFGGLIRLPAEMDEDSIIPLGNFIADYAARNLALTEDHNFFVGTGAGSGINGSVEGLTKSTITNSKTTVSGVLGSPSEFTLAHFRALRSVPAASALRMGAYYMHPSFERLLSSFNSSGDRPYNPNAQLNNPNAAQPFINGPTLDGFPIRWIDVMPVLVNTDVVSTVHVLFGDVRYQYLAPRGPIRFQTSIEAAFETDEVLMRALERFTIGLMATGAVGGLITHSA